MKAALVGVINAVLLQTYVLYLLDLPIEGSCSVVIGAQLQVDKSAALLLAARATTVST